MVRLIVNRVPYREMEDRRIPSGNGMREVIVVPGSENLGNRVVYMEREELKPKRRDVTLASLRFYFNIRGSETSSTFFHSTPKSAKSLVVGKGS